MRVRIAQCLCPKRHAILALGVEGGDLSDAEIETALRDQVLACLASDVIHPWCGLCGSPARDWQYEVRPSIEFKSWDAAKQELEAIQRENIKSRELADALGISYDAQRKARLN